MNTVRIFCLVMAAALGVYGVEFGDIVDNYPLYTASDPFAIAKATNSYAIVTNEITRRVAGDQAGSNYTASAVASAGATQAATNTMYSLWLSAIQGRTNLWNTAYGWGNWATRVEALDGRTNLWNAAYGWGDWSARVAALDSETNSWNAAAGAASYAYSPTNPVPYPAGLISGATNATKLVDSYNNPRFWVTAVSNRLDIWTASNIVNYVIVEAGGGFAYSAYSPLTYKPVWDAFAFVGYNLVGNSWALRFPNGTGLTPTGQVTETDSGLPQDRRWQPDQDTNHLSRLYTPVEGSDAVGWFRLERRTNMAYVLDTILCSNEVSAVVGRAIDAIPKQDSQRLFNASSNLFAAFDADSNLCLYSVGLATSSTSVVFTFSQDAAIFGERPPSAVAPWDPLAEAVWRTNENGAVFFYWASFEDVYVSRYSEGPLTEGWEAIYQNPPMDVPVFESATSTTGSCSIAWETYWVTNLVTRFTTTNDLLAYVPIASGVSSNQTLVNATATGTLTLNGNAVLTNAPSGIPPSQYWYASASTNWLGNVATTIYTNAAGGAFTNSFFSYLRLPKTGQTNTYWYCDDGCNQAGVAWPVPRFTVLSPGDATNRVRDNLYGYEWARDFNIGGAAATWENALVAVSNLNVAAYGGKTDWRLPNMLELLSICSANYEAPVVPNTAGTAKWTAGDPFFNLQATAFYWTSTVRNGATNTAVFVNFNYLYATPIARSSAYRVCAVRGP